MSRVSKAVVLALGLGALALAGCGGDDASEGPASAVPADSPLYIESVVNLEDAEGLNDALATVLGTDDPAAVVGEQLDAELEADAAPLSYTDDIEPLLGERGALFVQTFGPADAAVGTEEEGDAALVIETTDEDGARERIDELIAESGDPAEDATYGGVDYKLNPTEGDAVAVFDGFVVVGTEPAVQASIDASGGDSLADSEEFQSEVDAIAEDPVFTAYADVPAVLDGLQASGELDPSEATIADQALGGIADVPALVAISADSDKFALDVSVGVGESAARVPVTESELLRELPGDSWAATAVPDAGTTIDAALSQISDTAGPAAPDFEREVRAATGLDLGRLTAAIGDVGFFARGTNVLEAGGGAVVEDLDPTATADALEVLRRQVEREGEGEVVPLGVEGEGFAIQPPGAPQPINVVQRDDRVVAAYGDDATEDAFAATETLGDSETFTAAADALGDYAVSLFVDVGPAVDLAESAGATDDPEYAQVQPYLERLDYLITGGSSEEDRDRLRVVLGLTE